MRRGRSTWRRQGWCPVWWSGRALVELKSRRPSVAGARERPAGHQCGSFPWFGSFNQERRAGPASDGDRDCDGGRGVYGGRHPHPRREKAGRRIINCDAHRASARRRLISCLMSPARRPVDLTCPPRAINFICRLAACGSAMAGVPFSGESPNGNRTRMGA